MFTIARRVAIDLRRRPSSRSLTEPYQVEAELIGPDSAEELVIGLVVRDVLDALSDSHRQILELTFLEDLSQKEVADRLGIPVGTVKSRTYHAIRAFTRAASENDL
jgi:RNA polymerase sigma-70 factor (ECF subfamily)